MPFFWEMEQGVATARLTVMASWKNKSGRNFDSNPRLAGAERGEPRAVQRRTHTFRPNYLSFAGTYQCNLSCPHCCVPIEWPDRLDISVALRFLEDAAAHGIGILGLTGGEPFLYPEFVHTVCRRGVELRFRFDKIVTNGVWHENTAQL